MCECGCTSNDDRYTLPGPGRSFYVISLSNACINCDAPPGVTIEHIEPGHVLYAEYSDSQFEFINGPLPLEKWPDGPGVVITTGMRRCEFIKAFKDHLIGVDSRQFGGEQIDDIGAEVILEEMYPDSQVRPTCVVPKDIEQE